MVSPTPLSEIAWEALAHQRGFWPANLALRSSRTSLLPMGHSPRSTNCRICQWAGYAIYTSQWGEGRRDAGYPMIKTEAFSGQMLGFQRTTRPGRHSDSRLNRAAMKAGFSKETAHEFAGALGEMQSNIYEHSEAAHTGVVAFSASPELFEFVVADRGIGVLSSLKTCPEHVSLTDHGDALELALTDGSSRYGSGTNHGKGFRPLFIGLSNLNGLLRFRSGDHALTIEGRDPKHLPWTKARKALISGFLASVACSLNCAK
jgi:hypothetical protein